MLKLSKQELQALYSRVLERVKTEAPDNGFNAKPIHQIAELWIDEVVSAMKSKGLISDSEVKEAKDA
jgi:hypothetical protein